MLYPLVALLGLFLFGRMFAKHPRTSFNEFQWRRMYTKYTDLKHRIEYCSTETELSFISDEILDFFQLYKFEQGIKSYTGELFAMVENRRQVLQNYKKKLRA